MCRSTPHFPTERMRFIIGDAEVKAIVSMADFEQRSRALEVAEDLARQGQARDRRQVGASRLTGVAPPRRSALLHHLHLGHDRQSEGRRHRAREHLQFRARRRRALRLCAGRPRLPGHDDRLRLLDRGDLGAADGRRDARSGAAGPEPDRRRARRLPARAPRHRLACCPTLLATIEQDLPQLRILLVGGEACPQNLVARWYRPGRRILNSYGPTEATVTATLTELKPDKPVTIGVPLPTYSIVILDPVEDKTVRDRRARRDRHRRRRPRARLPQSRRTHDEEVHPRLPQHPEQPVRAHLSHRRPRPHRRERRDRVSRPHRHARSRSAAIASSCPRSKRCCSACRRSRRPRS